MSGSCCFGGASAKYAADDKPRQDRPEVGVINPAQQNQVAMTASNDRSAAGAGYATPPEGDGRQGDARRVNSLPLNLNLTSSFVSLEDLASELKYLEPMREITSGDKTSISLKGMWLSTKVAIKFVFLPGAVSKNEMETVSKRYNQWIMLMGRELLHPGLVQTFLTRMAVVDTEKIAAAKQKAQDRKSCRSIGDHPNPGPSEIFESGDRFGSPTDGIQPTTECLDMDIEDVLDLPYDNHLV
eukprot:gene16752-23026_t